MAKTIKELADEIKEIARQELGDIGMDIGLVNRGLGWTFNVALKIGKDTSG